MLRWRRCALRLRCFEQLNDRSIRVLHKTNESNSYPGDVDDESQVTLIKQLHARAAHTPHTPPVVAVAIAGVFPGHPQCGVGASRGPRPPASRRAQRHTFSGWHRSTDRPSTLLRDTFLSPLSPVEANTIAAGPALTQLHLHILHTS